MDAVDRHLRPYPLESTGTHPNSEVKSVRACPSTEMSDLSGTVGAVVFGLANHPIKSIVIFFDCAKGEESIVISRRYSSAVHRGKLHGSIVFNDPAAGSPTATLLRLTSYLLFIIQSLDSSSRKTSEIVTGGVYKLQGLIQYPLLIHTY